MRARSGYVWDESLRSCGANFLRCLNMRKFTHVWESRTMALEGMPVKLDLVSVWTSEGSLRIGGCAEMKMGREGNEVNGLIKECFFLPQRYILTPCRFSVCLATTWWFFLLLLHLSCFLQSCATCLALLLYLYLYLYLYSLYLI